MVFPVAGVRAQIIDETHEHWLLRTYPHARYLCSDYQQPGKYPALDQLVRSTYLVETVLNGTYEDFVADQKVGRLTKESFKELKNLGWHILGQYYSQADFFIEALIFRALSRSERIRLEFAPPNSDSLTFEREYLRDLAGNTELQPQSFGRHFLYYIRTLIASAAGLAHFDQILRLEGGPEMFHDLASINPQPIVLDIALFVHYLDVAGCEEFNERSYEGYKAVARACHAMLARGVSAESVYLAALQERAQLYGFPEDSVLHTRLAAMMGLATPEEGLCVQIALKELPFACRAFLPCPRLTATHMSAVLRTIMDITQGELLEKVGAAVRLGLPLLRKGLALSLPPDIPHCFKRVAEQIKEGVLIAEGTIISDEKGNISLKFPPESATAIKV